MIRLLRRALLVLSALVVLCLGTLVLLARMYDAEVKAKLIGMLNAHLRTPVTVSDMDLTLIQRFPRASIHLRDVLAHEVLADSNAVADTLLYARDLYLDFGLLSLFRGDYTVNEVHGEGVKLYPELDTRGDGNYHIWKSDSLAAERKAISLDRVTFNGLVVRYRDARSTLEILARSDALALSGRFTKEGTTLKLRGDVSLDRWLDEQAVVLSDRRADLDLDLTFGAADGAFRITRGDVLIADGSGRSGRVPLAMTMAVTPGAKGDELDLKANGFGLDLGDIVQLLPETARHWALRYALDGEVDLALTYKGPINEGPALSVGMKVHDGRLKEQRSGAVLSEVGGECAFELTPKGGLARLLVKHFSAQAASGSISGHWDMKGSKNAPLTADLRGDIALADLMHLLQVDTLEEAAGRLRADLHVEGRLRDVTGLKAADLRGLKITGKAQLKDATLKMKGIRHRVTSLNTELVLNGTDASVPSLDCAIQGSQLHLHGDLRNLMPYLLFDGQPLMIVAEGSSPRIDLGALLRNDSKAAASSSDYGLKLPSLIQLDLHADVDELVFEDFRATNISGALSLKDRVLKAKPVIFQSAEGAVIAEMVLDGRPDGAYPLTIFATVKDIDVRELFAEFQEFGQTFITSKHLSGTAQAQVTFTAPLRTDLRLDLDGLHCVTDIAISNGGILKHPQLMDVATYVKENKLIAPFVDVEELRTRLADVTFSRLENRIEIRDRQVIIPAMTVHSSAMDVELSGTHGFDDQIDHHLNFRLSELLRKDDPDDEFGPVVDDGTGLRIFLHMYGDANDPRFETDGAMAAQRRSEQIKEQTAELRSILRNELNPFKKKDDQPVATGGGGAQPRFDVEWENDSSATQPKRTSKERKGIGRLLGDGEEEPEATFEVEP